MEHYQRLIDGRYNVIGKARELVCVSGVSLSDDGYLVGDVVHDWTTVVTDNEPHTPVDEVNFLPLAHSLEPVTHIPSVPIAGPAIATHPHSPLSAPHIALCPLLRIR